MVCAKSVLVDGEDVMVPNKLVTDALRRIHLEMRSIGLCNQDLQHLYPHIGDCEEFEAIMDYLQSKYRPQGSYYGKAQIIYHLPDYKPVPLTYHMDVPPEKSKYTFIVAVPLVDWNRENGTVYIKYDDDLYPVVAMAGIPFYIPPDALHSPGINMSALPRIGLYYRWIEWAAS